MDTRDAILTEAQRLFDVAGIAHYGDNTVVIVGLVTSAERDLDEFTTQEDGSVTSDGFAKYMEPGLHKLARFIQGWGLSARQRGRQGYSLNGDLGLKKRAVAAGIARWGKNAVLLHPEYGPWLRLGVIETEVQLPTTGSGADSHESNPLCQDCDACIEACPEGILVPYAVADRWRCRAHFGNQRGVGRVDVCNRCLDACPVGRGARPPTP